MNNNDSFPKKQKVPKLIYKYKSISSIEDLNRILDIIKMNHIYVPQYFQLNDPLEGAGANIELDGWPGMSLGIAADEELVPIEEMKQKFRILSLSANPVSPQLWAHYTSTYQGVCFCFSTENTFSSIKPVHYMDPIKGVFADDEQKLETAVLNNFFYKQSGWSYEEEWRIILKNIEENKYLKFSPEEFRGVILGDKLDRSIQELVITSLPENVKVIKSRPGYQTRKINLLPWDYEYDYDGSKIQYIENIEEYLL